jgi:transmembrane sensor
MSTESTEQTEQTAAEWLIRRHSGTWGQSDQAELDLWLGESSLNLVAYLRLELGWEEAGRLRAVASPDQPDLPPFPSQLTLTPFFDPQPPTTPNAQDVPSADATPSIAPSIAPSKASSRRSLFAVAATVILAAGIGTYVAMVPNDHRYTTPVGGIRSVPMTDGSKVTLNTDSRIRVDLAERERRVELDKGEAFFEVAKDPIRPFVVTVGSKRVIAVGTQFSVRRDASDVQVIVTEGEVRIEDTTAARAPAANGSSDVFLTPGAVARASDAGVLVQRKTLPEVEEQLSWRSGVLMFRNRTLVQAAAEFNRYNAQKLVIDDPGVASLPIEGNFRATNVAAFAQLLQNGYPVAVTEEGDRIVLKARRR